MAAKKATPLVPKLRFPQFRDATNWHFQPLSELAEPISERVGGKKCVPLSVTTGVGLVSQEEKFGRIIAGESYKNYIRLKANDFAYNKSSTKDFPEGYIARYTGNEDAAVPNSIFTCFRTSGTAVMPQYLDQLFQANHHGRWLRKYITVGARAHGALSVNDDDLMSMPVPLPPASASLPEQQKIANFLGSLDDLIEAERRKLDILRLHKVGLMQNLFPKSGETGPTLRFAEFQNQGEWENRKAGSMFANRRAKGEKGLPLYSVTMNDGMVRRDSFDRNYYDIEEASKNKMAFEGDIVYNMMRMWQGALGVAHEDCMVSPAYIVLNPKRNVVPKFFEYLFKLPTTLQLLTAHSRGLTKDRLRLYYDDFARISLRCPNEPEQKRIADCLSSLDGNISAQVRRLEMLSLHKKGLLQQLFPTSQSNR